MRLVRVVLIALSLRADPWDEKQQQIFPRKYFMEQICGVFTESGRTVPVILGGYPIVTLEKQLLNMIVNLV